MSHFSDKVSPFPDNYSRHTLQIFSSRSPHKYPPLFRSYPSFINNHGGQDKIALCLSGNILSPLKLFFPQLRTGSKLVPKCLMRSVHTRFLCFLAATPQKLYKNTVFRIFRKGTILSGRNIMSKHFLGLGQHRAAWGSTLKS